MGIGEEKAILTCEKLIGPWTNGTNLADDIFKWVSFF